MKLDHFPQDARVRIAPLAAVIAAAVIALAPANARAGLKKNKATVQIGFLGIPPSQLSPPVYFQHVLLNVIGVRVNPKANAGGTEKHWQRIPAPPGGVNGAATNSGDLQIDLNTIQNVPVIFNSALLRPESGGCSGAKGAKAYQIAELDLDPTNPGSLVPFCGQAGDSEGCISYPIVLDNVGTPIVTTVPMCLQAGKGQTSTFLLQVQMNIVQAPETSGGPYTVHVTINPISDNSTYVGTVTGTVKMKSSSSLEPPIADTNTTTGMKHTRSLVVTAEAAETDTVVGTAPVVSDSSVCGSVPTPCYVLQLPAGGPPGQPGQPASTGTYYDLYVSGGGDSYDATRLPPLYAGQMMIVPDFTVKTGQKYESVSGDVFNGCVCGSSITNCSEPLVGAIAELLIPPDSNPTAVCSSPETANQCVVVASGSTADNGHFPLPGTAKEPAPLDSVPPLLANSPYPYTLMLTAPGYDTAFMSPVIPGIGANKTKCAVPAPSPVPAAPCEVPMNTGYISGTVQALAPMTGKDILAQVYAEETGTNNLVSALQSPVILRSSANYSKTYTLNVPTESGHIDLIASTIDQYQGAADPYPGHSIEAISNITPLSCKTVTSGVSFEESENEMDNNPLSCVGHGSVIGTVTNPDLGTSVVVSKTDSISGNPVQIARASIQNVNAMSGTLPSNEYSFCLPADTYTLQRYEVPSPADTGVAPSVVPTPSPDGTPVEVTIPQPMFIGTPSPTATASPTASATPTGGATPTMSPTASPTPTPAPPTCPTVCYRLLDGACPGTCLSANPSPL
ncbi:MAG: hypothetical protein ACREQI_01265 [Candidatus Binataceae bacterium]